MKVICHVTSLSLNHSSRPLWCISNVFGSYSKTCIVKVRASWGRVSRGLTVKQFLTQKINYSWNYKLENEVLYVYNKLAVALGLTSCDHQQCKLQVVAGAERFRVAELRVRQLKIGCKSCFIDIIISPEIVYLCSQAAFCSNNVSCAQWPLIRPVYIYWESVLFPGQRLLFTIFRYRIVSSSNARY